MIEFYIWYTSNARKVAIILEETGLDFETRVVDIGRGEQFDPDFLKISPNNKIPAIVDHDGPGGKPLALFESGAILIYLAEKTGAFLPAAGAERYAVHQWLMFQMAGVGPMFGQYNHFHNYAREAVPYARQRYAQECARLYGVMDRVLAQRDYVAGDYSIADMALYPWVSNFAGRGQDPDAVPHVAAWAKRVGARPAVQRAMALIGASPRPGPIDDEHWENMYGATQYQRR
ncbi:MAG: glutathione S-transferase family protein [Alphaproteobacteria bacterium]|nr:MAG: glutathione S-transferase family protein [Alphaproteobacteria bacterium]